MCPQETPASKPDLTRLTRRQAEAAAGVSRATLARYVADGKLTAGKDGQGHNVYDASELQRVFPDSFDLRRLEIPDARDGLCPDDAGQDTPRDTASLTMLTVEMRYLKEDRDRLKEEAERLRRELSEERQKREDERSEFMGLIRQNQETVKQLTDQRSPPRPKEEPPPASPKGVWAWLMGR